MQCPSCGFENPEGMSFCEACGTTLVRVCSGCGHEVGPTAKFCGKCGTVLSAPVPSRPQSPAKPKSAQRPAKTPLRSRAKSQKPKAKRSPQGPSPRASEAERRQLTVMFCDLVGSTPLAEQLDPEDLREVVRQYHAACETIIHRFDGYIARYVGDALLVYFGYPVAHEDDAQRAVRAGLGIVAAMPHLNTQLQLAVPALHELPLQVRIGIHTGLVVVGEMRGDDYREQMALGETPNIAARLQGLAAPNTVIISALTQRLTQGFFECQDQGLQALKGVSAPLQVYRVVGESDVQSRFEVAIRTGLTPLVGRDEELVMLRHCWEKTKTGAGQMVLLSGEAGIGKSRLVQELKAQVAREGGTRIEFRCSPYYQHTAFYPVTEYLQRLLQFQQDDSSQEKLAKLEHMLQGYSFPLHEAVSLFAALLSLPHPDGYPPLNLTPQKQRHKTQEVLGAWLAEEATRTPLLAVWEDLQWADPSTLELHTLFMERVATTSLLTLLVYRPEFRPPWPAHAKMTALMLRRLPPTQAVEMVERVTGGRALPPAVLQQIVAKTDGVPLFVEELTKMVLESGFLRQTNHHYELTGPLSSLAIPVTLHDALMARLDRLHTAKELAQLGATLGREFSYGLIQAVSPFDEETLQQSLSQLVATELVYQRGLPPQAKYIFKHALVQDAAYQSLLKSRRQQYHQQIAHVLVDRFPETVATQPELVAHHYTEAGLSEQAVPYWQRAGQRAAQRSAHAEAAGHFTKGLALLKTLPDTPDRIRQELSLQTALSSALVVTKGLGAHDVRKAYDEARELCQRMAETPQLGPVLIGLSGYYIQQEELGIASSVAEQCLALAERQHDASLIVAACRSLVNTAYWGGNPRLAHEYCERGMACYDPRQHHALALIYGFDPIMSCLGVGAWALWYLGYPDQALQRSQAALTLAREGNHLYTLAFALNTAAWTRFYRREARAACALAGEAIALSTAQEFPHWLAMGRWMRGQALIELGQWEEGTAQLQQGIETYQATGAVLGTRGCAAAELARGYGGGGHIEEGARLIGEALAGVNQVRHYEAEMYRLKGELALQQARVQRVMASVRTPHSEAEACFLKAIEIARRQSAKSLELRAVMSVSRLWQQQGKKEEARRLLAQIYSWFTEGFDTKDLQEARVLLTQLQ